MRNFISGNGQKTNFTQSRLHWLHLTSFLLVSVILISMVSGVVEVVRGFNIELGWSILGIGLLVSWGLVRFGSRGWSVALFTFFSGLLFSAMMVGRLWDEWETLWNNLIWWLGTALQSLIGILQGEVTTPSLGTLFFYIFDFSQGVFVMLQRFVLWIWRFPRMNNDLISILMVWSMLIWITVIWSAWYLWRRGRPLEAVIPAFVLVAVARSYSDASSNLMLVMLGSAIALMIISAQVNRERDWANRQIGYSELIRKNSTQAAMMLSAVLVFVSGGVTSIDMDKVIERWEDFSTRRSQYTKVNNSGVSSSLGIDRDSSRVTLAEQFSKLSQGGLPTDLLVGSGPELADEVVMVVRVEETDPNSGNPLNLDPATQTYYFRSLTYDKYTSAGWFSTGGRIFVYQSGQEAVTTYTNRQRLIKQEVRYEQQIRTTNKVYVVGDLAVVDRLYNVSWREGESLAEFTDIFGATFDGWSYEAYSVVPVFSEMDLRNSALDYPDWIIDRYLQLPDTVPSRVINLSYELTSQELTAYDKAVAIEQYIRSFPYTLDLPIKTASRDIADYFLFDVQRGYCDYYASTMIVLARAAGLPARLAVGYIGGTYDEENDYYVVTADKAHSWVEVYFPEFGWVTFEPTAGRVALERETMEFDLPEFEYQITFTEEKLQLSGLEILGWSVLGLIVLALLSFMVWLRVDVFVLKRQSIDKAFGKMYRRMLWLGRLLGVQRGITQTPMEFSSELKERLDQLRTEHRPLGFLEKTGAHLESLIRLANKAAYSAEAADAFERARAVDLWIRLRRNLGIAILWKWLAGLVPKIKEKQAAQI
jgi:transglutaminase-like putative cysteine protease